MKEYNRGKDGDIGQIPSGLGNLIKMYKYPLRKIGLFIITSIFLSILWFVNGCADNSEKSENIENYYLEKLDAIESNVNEIESTVDDIESDLNYFGYDRAYYGENYIDLSDIQSKLEDIKSNIDSIRGDL